MRRRVGTSLYAGLLFTDIFSIRPTPDESAAVVVGAHLERRGDPLDRDLEGGWNLVGAPEKNDAQQAFEGSTATQTQLIHSLKGPENQPAFMTGVDASGDDPAWTHTFSQNADKCVSPYTGYWMFVDEDDTGSLPSQLYEGVTFTDEIGLLTTDHSCESLKSDQEQEGPIVIPIPS